MNKTFYLAYGSNLNLEQMAHRCPTAKPVGPVVLKDYQLLFRGGHGGSVATVELFKGKTVPCLVKHAMCCVLFLQMQFTAFHAVIG